MKTLINKLPRRFQFTIHNMIAHPLLEVFYQLGLSDLATWIHEETCPDDPSQSLNGEEYEDSEN